MVKVGVFISYETGDVNKCNSLAKKINATHGFKAIVVARDRAALKLFTEKVAKAITKSKIFIPIITANSIKTQWINQEIGFAFSRRKSLKILPIIEEKVLFQLKGFIHSQMDLPYKFISSTNAKTERSHFRNCCNELIADHLTYKRPIVKKELEIIAAEYGRDLHSISVAQALREKIKNNKLHIIVGNELAGDPFPGYGKTLSMTYRIGGKIKHKEINEGAELILP